MKPNYDAIIVGARPAGASTAMLLARLGHRVLLVDRVVMPADTISTHALLRTAMLQLRRWGIDERLWSSGTPAIRDLTLGFDGDRVSTTLKCEHGVDAYAAPRRTVLDHLLVEAAVEAGVDLADATTVVDVTHNGDRVAGVLVADERGRRQISSKVVIGADGVNSRVARSVGSATQLAHPPRNAVHYSYFTDVDHGGFWFQFTAGVNAGLITTNDGLTCAFVARPQSEMNKWRGDPDGEFVRLLGRAGDDLSDLVMAGERVEPFRGTTGLPGYVRRAWGPGWSLVGDAGYSIDPVSAHGISSALRDAELCARAVDRWLRHPPCEHDAMNGYEAIRDRLSADILAASTALTTYRWTGAEASAHMRMISNAVRVECEAITDLPGVERSESQRTPNARSRS